MSKEKKNEPEEQPTQAPVEGAPQEQQAEPQQAPADGGEFSAQYVVADDAAPKEEEKAAPEEDTRPLCPVCGKTTGAKVDALYLDFNNAMVTVEGCTKCRTLFKSETNQKIYRRK